MFYHYNISHKEIGEEEMELRLCSFSMVPLPSFVGNLLKQLPKIRSADGSWNSWLSVIKDGDQLYLFFFLFLLEIRSVELCCFIYMYGF